MIQSVRMDLVITRLEEKQDMVLDTLRTSGSVGQERLVGSEGIKFEVRSGSGVYIEIQASFGSSFFFLARHPVQGSLTSPRHTALVPHICLRDRMICFD